MHVVFVSTFPPRRCGIASFTQDLQGAMARGHASLRTSVIPIVEAATDPVEWPAGQASRCVLRRLERADYRQAAEAINRSDVDVVSLQHEFGLFGGGDRGEFVIDLLRCLRKPVVVTLHTVSSRPTSSESRVLRDLVRYAARLVVMTRAAVPILRELYGVEPERIRVIPHGVPASIVAAAHADGQEAAASWGLEGRKVLTTFGLVSRGKGLEYGVKALAQVVRRYPEALYVIAGQTHPNVLREEGEAYRTELQELARSLGVQEHVRFINRFLTTEELGRLLAATDIYITPYLSGEQITSGTLSYALAAGRAVVSTPYRHAREALGDGAGVLCAFRDPASLAKAILQILDQPSLQRALGRMAFARYGQGRDWASLARSYGHLFREVAGAAELRGPQLQPSGWTGSEGVRPAVRPVGQPAVQPVMQPAARAAVQTAVRAAQLLQPRETQAEVRAGERRQGGGHSRAMPVPPVAAAPPAANGG